MKNFREEDFVVAKRHAKISVGETIRMLRDLKGWTQQELEERSGISETNLSLLENDKVDIGKKRAEQLAKAFGVHPAIIMFPEYEMSRMSKTALKNRKGT